MNGILAATKLNPPATRGTHAWSDSAIRLVKCAATAMIYNKRFDPTSFKPVCDQLKVFIPTLSVFVNTTPHQTFGDFFSFDIWISLDPNTTFYARSHCAHPRYLRVTDSQIVDFFFANCVN